MNDKPEIVRTDIIQSRIFAIRGLQVMIDRDLAELFGVKTKRLNEQVKRNTERFPEEFCFQLTEAEKDELVAKCDHLNNLKFSHIPPYAFTEQGVAMLSAVLKSETAIKMSIQVIKAFVTMRRFIATNVQIFQRLDNLEIKQLETDKKNNQVLNAIEEKEIKPKQGIFYDGQIFDAYLFVCDLFRSAQKSIIIIDNYIDDSVLTQLAKKKHDVKVTILTKKISRQLALDAQKFNAQYPTLEIKEFLNGHDRFLIIDDSTLYHFGASLKDLGKKWFAFSKMEMGSAQMLAKLTTANKV